MTEQDKPLSLGFRLTHWMVRCIAMVGAVGFVSNAMTDGAISSTIATLVDRIGR